MKNLLSCTSKIRLAASSRKSQIGGGAAMRYSKHSISGDMMQAGVLGLPVSSIERAMETTVKGRATAIEV